MELESIRRRHSKGQVLHLCHGARSVNAAFLGLGVGAVWKPLLLPTLSQHTPVDDTPHVSRRALHVNQARAHVAACSAHSAGRDVKSLAYLGNRILSNMPSIKQTSTFSALANILPERIKRGVVRRQGRRPRLPPGHGAQGEPWRIM